MTEFDRSEPVKVVVQAQRGTVDIIAEERVSVLADVVPTDGHEASHEAVAISQIVLEGDTLFIRTPSGGGGWGWRRSPKLAITVRVPTGSTLQIKSASADVRATGTYATAHVGLSSADAYVESVAGDAHLDAQSGDLAIGRVGGALRVHSASGDLEIGDVTGDVSARTASGRIGLRSAGGSVDASTASGRINVGVLRRGHARLKSASGDVTVGVAAGTGVWLDLNTASGTTSSDLAMGGGPADGGAPALELRVRTASGDIDVHRVTDDVPANA